MAINIQAERERRDALAKDTRNLLDTNTGDGHTWTDEHQKRYDDNMAEIERIDAAIAREQKLLDLTAEERFKEAGLTERDAPKDQAQKLFNKWLRGGDNALTAEDWHAIRNTMSTGTDSEGGYTVPTEVATSILDALKAYGGMRAVADIIRTAGGNPMQFPTSDGTSEVGEIVGENTAATDADISFGVKDLPVYKYSSKVVTVPWELLQDTGTADLEGFIRARLQTRLGRITNKHFTVGTGSSQPKGIITAATVGVTGDKSATAKITYEDLIDLEHSVDPAYRGNASYMFHDDMLKMIRKLKDENGRPISVPGYEQGNPGGAPDRILNRNITINQDMDSPAVSKVSVAFGDFSYYKIRDVMAVTLFRFTDSAYTKKGQVGFLAWMRSGGNLVDVGGAVKTFKHGAAS